MYINFLELIEETQLDFSQDTYDGGLHLNLSGAEKITKYLGQVLSEEVGLTNRKNEADLSEIWKKKITEYESEQERQYKELQNS